MPYSEHSFQESLEILVPPDTKRLRFRPVCENDHDAVRSIYSDPLALRFFPTMQTPEGVQLFIDRQHARYREFGYGIWLIESLQERQLAGCAGLSWQTADVGEVLEVGYGLVADERGKGLATEAARACRDFGFDVLRAGRVASVVHTDNAASEAVAARVHKHRRLFIHPVLAEEFSLYYTDVHEREA